MRVVSIELGMNIVVEVICGCDEECGSSGTITRGPVEVLNFEDGSFSWLVPWPVP